MMMARASVLVHASLGRGRAAVLDPDAHSHGAIRVQERIVESRRGDQLVAWVKGHPGPFRSHIRARPPVGEREVDLEPPWGRPRDFHAVFLMEPRRMGCG